MGSRPGPLSLPPPPGQGGPPTAEATAPPWLGQLLDLLAAQPAAPGPTTDLSLDALAAAGLGDPWGLALLLAPLPEGLAQPAALDRLGGVHVGIDAVERLAARGEGGRAFYRFDVEGLRAVAAGVTPART